MRNRDQILHELLLRGKLLGIHHHQSAAMRLTEVNEQAPSKTSQSIFVGNEQQRDFPSNDRIDESEKLLALEIESPANFCNPFIDDISIGGAPLGEHPALVLQIRFLRRTGHPAIANCSPLGSSFLRQDGSHIFLGILPPVGRCSMGFEYPLSIPSLQGLHGNTDPLAKFARCIHVHILHTSAYFVKS